MLDLRWDSLTAGKGQVTRPTVTVVRYTTYLDVSQTIADCLTRSGYRTTAWSLTKGVIDPVLDAAHQFPYEKAKYVCEAKYPEDPADLGFLSDEQEQYLLSYWQSSLIPCLRAAGVEVPDLPPIGQYGEGNQAVGPLLNPYARVSDAPEGITLPLLWGRCPPYPGELYAGSASRQ
jgi:hypothetical protein